MDGMPARCVSVAPSYHESSPPSLPGRPTSRVASCIAPTIGSDSAISSGMTPFGHHSIVGGCSASQSSFAVSRAIHSSTSLRMSAPQPPASACRGMYMTAMVRSHDAGYVTGHSPAAVIVGSSAGRERYGWSSPSRAAHSARSERIASITTVAFSIAFTAPPARQSGCRTSA